MYAIMNCDNGHEGENMIMITAFTIVKLILVLTF